MFNIYKNHNWQKDVKVILPQQDKDGRFLAHCVAYYGEPEDIKCLIKANADFNVVDNKNNPAWSYLIWYAKNPAELITCFKLLLEYDEIILDQHPEKYLQEKITPNNKAAKQELISYITDFKKTSPKLLITKKLNKALKEFLNKLITTWIAAKNRQ